VNCILPEVEDAPGEKSGPEHNAQDVMDEDFESFLDWRLSGEVYHQAVGVGFTIAIETSVAQGSVALARQGEVIRTEQFEASRRSSEVLIAPLSKILDLVGDDRVELVLVGTGPGSYNGARVGIAAAQGIGIVHHCPAVGISSLEGLPVVRSGGPCVALGDARRGAFFTTVLSQGKLLEAPVLSDHTQFEQRVRGAVERGWSLVTLDESSRLGLSDCEILTEVPAAVLLLEAWLGRSPEEQQELLGLPPQPFYLRPPHITQPGGASGKSGGSPGRDSV